MRKILPFCILLFISLPALAQQQTLFKGETENGLYFGPTLHVSRVSADAVYFTGFRGAWIVNHTFAFGYGSYGMGGEITAPAAAREFYARNSAPRTMLELDFRYRGIELEYIMNWKRLFHFGLYTLVGSGTVNLGDPEDRGFSLNDQVFVVAPALNGMLNVTTRITMTLGVSYRFVAGVDLAGVDSSGLNGPALGMEFRIGRF